MSQRARAVMSGEERSAKAHMLRALTAVAEPGYAIAMRIRNGLYDAKVARVTRLTRPAVSVGNITTGGTGKTPVVRWLADRFKERGVTPAVLMRGYRKGASVDSDERAILAQAGLIAEAAPSRVESAGRVLRDHPEVGVFLLDDSFQHRKVARDFDLVLVNAADPFGFGHVLPRGLLREPLTGLRRADAILLTRADQASDDRLAEIERTVRKYNSDAPIYRASHAHVGLRHEGGLRPIEELRQLRVFALAGIGNPESLGQQLKGKGYVGHRWFPDHHDYTASDVSMVRDHAKRAGADVLLTTEKDWVKLSRLGDIGMPVYRLELDIRFHGDGGARLLDQVREACALGKATGLG